MTETAYAPLSGDNLQAFQDLRRLSASIGGDPALVQGAGGNTSLKAGGLLWIKASGTWLMHADRRDSFVPVALAPLLAALADDAPEAEKAQAFVVGALNPSGLRPSIETTVHALTPQRVVVHVHCVETISRAVDAHAEDALAGPLAGLAWVYISYRRPG
ncbi:MAG TPA: class II aldolase/adducin family protein, partial [Methylomirabilota bacterium]|nr:class II aldolase/adducin family protein [Methylomirabilota bacterium]